MNIKCFIKQLLDIKFLCNIYASFGMHTPIKAIIFEPLLTLLLEVQIDNYDVKRH